MAELEALKRLLFQEWDPIGVSDCEGAEDEYDRYARQVFTILAEGAEPQAVASYLNWVVISQMSLPGNLARDNEIADKAVAIHESHADI